MITTREFQRLPGVPAVYEVSCPFPQGMSGGPVLFGDGTHIAVAGVVLGVDSVRCGGVENNVGIAMIADEIVTITSERLGGPIGAQLNFDGARMVSARSCSGSDAISVSVSVSDESGTVRTD